MVPVVHRLVGGRVLCGRAETGTLSRRTLNFLLHGVPNFLAVSALANPFAASLTALIFNVDLHVSPRNLAIVPHIDVIAPSRTAFNPCVVPFLLRGLAMRKLEGGGERWWMSLS